MDLRINDNIDTEKSAAGDPVSATVVHDVHPYQSKEVAIPAGAVAHGRVSRIEHHFYPYDYVVMGISFQSIEINGETSPFTAKPLNGGIAVIITPGSGSAAEEQRSRTVPISPAPTPQIRTPIGPASAFVFAYEKHHVMPAGTVSQWVATYPPPATPK
jgi:hypothetical protein